jgi:hypothetical protein
MNNYMELLRQRLNLPSAKSVNEVERIAALQKTAASRRAEYAEKRKHADLNGDESVAGTLATYRKRMEEAEKTYMVALQRYENLQSKQKSY